MLRLGTSTTLPPLPLPLTPSAYVCHLIKTLGKINTNSGSEAIESRAAIELQVEAPLYGFDQLWQYGGEACQINGSEQGKGVKGKLLLLL